MTEREKMIQGLPYNAGDPELMQARRRCKELCFAFNQTPPSQRDKQQALLRSLLVQADEKIHVAASACASAFQNSSSVCTALISTIFHAPPS